MYVVDQTRPERPLFGLENRGQHWHLKSHLAILFCFLSGSDRRRWLACTGMSSVTTTLTKVFSKKQQFLKELNCYHFGSKSCFKASNHLLQSQMGLGYHLILYLLMKFNQASCFLEANMSNGFDF